jgi:hypothetical protein
MTVFTFQKWASIHFSFRYNTNSFLNFLKGNDVLKLNILNEKVHYIWSFWEYKWKVKLRSMISFDLKKKSWNLILFLYLLIIFYDIEWSLFSFDFKQNHFIVKSLNKLIFNHHYFSYLMKNIYLWMQTD